MANDSVPANILTTGQSQATTWNPATVAAKNAADTAVNNSQAAYQAWVADGRPESGPIKDAVISAQAETTKAQESAINALNNDPQDTPVAPPNAGQIQKDDAPTTNTASGTGAGTNSDSAKSVGADNNPGPSSNTTQQAINTAFSNQRITSQPNVLDQYASYTYAISWWLLTPDQYNNLSSPTAPAPNTGNWSLLVQSGGAPAKGRNQAFPDDYYFDDLEIESTLAGKGAGMSNNGLSLKFKIVEPNGLTLLQNLFKAVSTVYKSTTQPINYVSALYCLTIEFYGYDSQGKLVAPATGSLSGSNAQAVIKKYYPFTITNIVFRTVAEQIEYYIEAQPVPYDTATSQARGTIPFSIALSGQTVGQLLQGSPTGATTASTADTGARVPTSAPTSAPAKPTVDNTPGWDNLASDVQMQAQQSWMDTYGNRYNADGSANWGGG